MTKLMGLIFLYGLQKTSNVEPEFVGKNAKQDYFDYLEFCFRMRKQEIEMGESGKAREILQATERIGLAKKWIPELYGIAIDSEPELLWNKLDEMRG